MFLPIAKRCLGEKAQISGTCLYVLRFWFKLCPALVQVYFHLAESESMARAAVRYCEGQVSDPQHVCIERDSCGNVRHGEDQMVERTELRSQKLSSTRKPDGILSEPSIIRSAITCATLGAIPKAILKPPLAM